MEYEQKYNAALERAAKLRVQNPFDTVGQMVEHIFPELKESEHEKIRKAILQFFESQDDNTTYSFVSKKDILAWLEKQGEQHSPVDIDKMVDEFANTEIEGYGFPSMIEVDAYRKGIEDVFEKQDGQTKLDYEHEELPEKDLEDLFQALPEKIVDEKSHQVYELCVYHYDGQCVVDYVGEIDHDSLYTFGGDTLYDAMEKAWNWLRKNSTGG